MATKGKYGKIIFSEDEIQFIKNNFGSMTNQEIADALGQKKTIVRTLAYQLNLQRITLEYWTTEATVFLKENYNTIGDLELCRMFSVRFPRTKPWRKFHIQKKMSQLGLHRNKLDLFIIKERNRTNGSFGKRNIKHNPEAPKVYFQLNPRTRIELRPGQTIEQLKLKYQITTP